MPLVVDLSLIHILHLAAIDLRAQRRRLDRGHLIREITEDVPVSYTHLGVYKRQAQAPKLARIREGHQTVERSLNFNAVIPKFIA